MIGRSGAAEATGALKFGIAGFAFAVLFPIVGVLLCAVGVWRAIRAVQRKQDENFAITVLSINAVTLSVAVAAASWSFLVGLYGVVLSPWPA